MRKTGPLRVIIDVKGMAEVDEEDLKKVHANVFVHGKLSVSGDDDTVGCWCLQSESAADGDCIICVACCQ